MAWFTGIHNSRPSKVISSQQRIVQPEFAVLAELLEGGG